MVKFLIGLGALAATLLGLYMHWITWTHLGIAFAVACTVFYLYKKFYTKDWEEFKEGYGKTIKWSVYVILFLAVCHQPLWFYGTAWISGPQQVFVMKQEALGSKDTNEAALIYPYGRSVWGWGKKKIPENIVQLRHPMVKFADGTEKDIAEVFPDLEVQRVLNYQMEWLFRKEDVSVIQNVLDGDLANGRISTVWTTGYYIETPQWVQDIFCPIEGKDKGNCLATHFNLVDARSKKNSDDMPRVPFVTLLYSSGLIACLVLLFIVKRKLSAWASRTSEKVQGKVNAVKARFGK